MAFVDRRGEFEWLSYAEFYQESAAYGQSLSERGVGKGDSCIFVLQSDRACAAALAGCLLIGGVPTLIAPPIVRGLHSNLPEVVQRISLQTSAKIVVLGDDSKSLSPPLEQAGLNLINVENLADGDASNAPLATPRGEDIAAMQLTSGTTGFPKICVWRQTGVLASLDGMEQAMHIGSDDICVNWTPLYHDMGLVNNFFLCLAKSIPLVWLQATDFIKRPAGWIRAMHNTGGTVTWSPNFGFAMTAQRTTEKDMEGIRLDHVRAFWNAAEKIHAKSIRHFQEKFEPYGLQPGAVKTNFGCAENVGGATFSAIDAPPVIERIERAAMHDEGIARLVADDSGKGGEAIVEAVSAGAPCPGMSIRILDADGAELPEGTIGEVALNTPSRMLHYLDAPEATALAIRGDELFTGDAGYLRNGELFWTGRVQEKINLKGKKYDPSDFEDVLLEVDGLREGCFAAFGVDDEELGSQKLVIVTEIRDASDRSHEEITADTRGRVQTEMNVSLGGLLLLAQGTMSKTSSGKRRHKFYQDLYLKGGLEAVASWAE